MRVESLQDLHMFFPDIDGFWETRDLTQAEQKIRSFLPIESESYDSKNVEVLSQLGRVLGLQGKLKEAQQVLENCQQRLATLPLDTNSDLKTRSEIRFYLEQGRYFCLSKFPTRALDNFKKAWLLAEKAQLEVFSIEIAYMLSITLPQKMSRDWLLKAIDMTKKSKNSESKKWIPILYMTEAWHKFDTRQFDQALSIFESALTECEDKENIFLQQNLKWCEARTLRALKKPETALKIQEKILSQVEAMGTAGGFVYLEIAECWRDLQDITKAQPYFELAYEALKLNTWYSENYAHELARIKKDSKKVN